MMKLVTKGHYYTLWMKSGWALGEEVSALEEVLTGLRGMIMTVECRLEDLHRYEMEEEEE